MLGRGAWFVWSDLPDDENLKWMLLPDGGFVYPNGQDWELFRNPSWLGKHVLMAVWAHDSEAWTWVLRGLEVLEKMQARSTEGAVFHPGEYFFASTQHDLFRSLANAWLSLAEKLVALTNLTTAEIATGLVGILNNPHWIYEQGRRRVAVNGQSIEVASGCGQPWQWETAGRIKVDDALEIVSPQPLRAAYLAAKGAERGRVTDRLILDYLAGNRTWVSGAVISDYQAVIRCRE